MTTLTATAPVAVDPTELRNLLDRRADVALIDVRSPGEFQSVHLAKSVNIPLDVLERGCSEVASAVSGPVVLICAQGVRSQQAAQLLAGEGLGDLRVLEGGINSWQSAGHEVQRGQGHWAMDRQVRLVAGSLVLSGVLASTKVAAAKWLAGAIGAGLTYSAVSNSCAMAKVLGYLPYNRGGTPFDFAAALEAIRHPSS